MGNDQRKTTPTSTGPGRATDDLTIICVCGDPPEAHHTASEHNDWARREIRALRESAPAYGARTVREAGRLRGLERLGTERTGKRH